MKIWFDISHPAQFNFYLNAIKKLSLSENVVVTVLDRGKLNSIAQKELSQVPCKLRVVGRHKGGKLSTIFDANIARLLKLYIFYFREKPDISVGNGFLHGMVSKTFGFPSIMFNDDMERKINVGLMINFSTEIYHITGSDMKNGHKKVKIFNALKEWAYLSSDYFKPDNGVLSEYQVDPKRYYFVREVITGTLNYKDQKENLIATIADKFPKKYKVLLSLEDKSKRAMYPDDWVLLKEPVNDIHSLIYHSRALVSSGDSMSREGAVLGVPSIYCGIREMKANQIMMDKSRLYFTKIQDVPQRLNDFEDNFDFESQDSFREALKSEWVDVTGFIIERVESYNKN